MRALSKQTFMSLECEIENFGKNSPLSNFIRILFFLSIYASIFTVSTLKPENDNIRWRVLNTSNDSNGLSMITSRPNWWQKKIERRPTLAVKDEPIGTGVPTWKEVDIFGSDSRRGRSYSNAFKDEKKSSAHRFVSSILMFIILNICLFSLNLS